MCGLAELLCRMGARVTGSDLVVNSQTQRLQQLGVNVFHGHQASYVKDCDVVIYSSAVTDLNEEFVAAKALEIPLVPRGEALAELMSFKRGITVAGTHGKTTATSFIASIFLEAGLDPTIVVGGRLNCIQSVAQLGSGEWLIAESDESDGSFSRLSPELILVTNIDNDHLDYYGSFGNLQKAFYDFACRIPFYGCLIYCGDDPSARRVFGNFERKKVSYGFESFNHFRVEMAQGSCHLLRGQEWVGSFYPALPGKHNVLNAVGAIILGMEAGLDCGVCTRAIEKFSGIDRRFDFLGEKERVLFYDDYAHHPTEVKAVLQTFKELFRDRRLVVCFQPHRYTRVKSCWSSFLDSFYEADLLFVTDIYAASEDPIQGVDSERFCRELKHPQVFYLKQSLEGLTKIKHSLKEGDVFVCLGAGDIYKWVKDLYT